MRGLEEALGEIPPPKNAGETPTWKTILMVNVFILCMLLGFNMDYQIRQWYRWRKKKNKVMFLVFERVKTEFIIFGYLSLLSLCGETYIVQLCMSIKEESAMPPYHIKKYQVETENATIYSNFLRRIFDASAACSASLNGKMPRVSLFIVILALFRISNSFLTVVLAKIKINKWKRWENETLSPSFIFCNDPLRFRLSWEKTFEKQHMMANFLCQFFRSVHKPEYLTLRYGFLNGHLAPGSEFNFHEFVNRSLAHDFKVILFFSPKTMAFVGLFLLLNVTGLQKLFWVSLIPLTTLLVVGKKLQAIITKMAVEIQVKHKIIQGAPFVQQSDQHFWFGHPNFVLSLINLILFQNTLQIVHFLWIWYGFGLEFSIHCSFILVIVRLCLGIGVQFWCSYNTLPLYELVSQMGSKMNKDIIKEMLNPEKENINIDQHAELMDNLAPNMGDEVIELPLA